MSGNMIQIRVKIGQYKKRVDNSLFFIYIYCMNRKDFLKRLGIGAAAVAVASHIESKPKKKKKLLKYVEIINPNDFRTNIYKLYDDGSRELIGYEDEFTQKQLDEMRKFDLENK